MLERFIQTVICGDAGDEDIAVTRERLKDRFPRGATRRMTQLGMLVSAALDELGPRSDDAIVFASGYGESRTLEAYIDSFPMASPTAFQTSIHPSAVQQALIGRQLPVGEFLPLTGRAQLVAHVVQAALLSPATRVLLCGGEERGGWLLEQRAASERSFAFALALGRDAGGALGALRLLPIAEETPGASFALPEFFAALAARRALDVVAAPGLRLQLAWS